MNQTLIATIEPNHIVTIPPSLSVGEQVMIIRMDSLFKFSADVMPLNPFRLPDAVHARLQFLLDRQDQGISLTSEERKEAEGLVELADFLTLLNLRATKTN